MPDIMITEQAHAFLNLKLIGRLATASPEGQPHVVPVWFLWQDGAAWISSYRSTRKIYDIRQNPKCALVVDIENNLGGLTAVVMEGFSEIIEKPEDFVRSRILEVYVKYLGEEGVNEKDPQTWLNSAENVLVRLTPTKIKAW